MSEINATVSSSIGALVAVQHRRTGPSDARLPRSIGYGLAVVASLVLWAAMIKGGLVALAVVRAHL